MPARHLLKSQAEGKQIGSRVGRAAGQLLWAHVPRRADEPFVVVAAVRPSSSQTEVDQLGARGGHHDIGGLHVAVCHAETMRLGQRIHNLHGVPDDLLRREWPVFQALRQRPPRHKLHNDEVNSRSGSDIVDRADVRMIQAGEDARFPFQRVAGLGVERHVVGQRFEGDMASQPDVERTVHNAHPAPSDRSHQLVWTKAAPSRQEVAGVAAAVVGGFVDRDTQQTAGTHTAHQRRIAQASTL
jgi:hypothetical protein